MFVKEMHIEFTQATQNIAAAVRRKLFPEEIDWLLNKTEERLIHNAVTPAAQGSTILRQFDVNLLRTLKKTAEATAISWGENQYTIPLPADYRFLTESESAVNCGARPDCSAVAQTITVVKLPKSSKAAAPFYTLSLVIGAESAITMAEIAQFFDGPAYTGLKGKDELFLIRNSLLWYLRNIKKLEVYWESYLDIYHANSMIFVDKPLVTLTLDDQVIAGTTYQLNFTHYNVAGVYKPNRTVEEKVSTLMATPYVRTHLQSPLCELENNQLIVYGNKSFIVSKVRVSYLRKSRPISLLLGSGSELPEDYHQSICDLAAEYFKAMTADPNWEVKLRDNMQRSVATTI